MMAAYNPTPGGGHPGLPHGHPAMGPNPGQHMGQPMQMHPGVSGAPHVSQPGAMMGMQPGAQMGHGGMGGQHPGGMMQAQMGGQSMPGGMPNAQAMNHMTPQQHMQQQQAMAAHLQANPALAQQQQMMRMRHQQMLAQQQQQQQNGMMNMQGGNMQLTPQQLAHLQQQQQAQQQGMQGGNQPVQLPAHLAQQMALRQQQMQAQAQQQQHQMAQQLAMQQANSQQSNQGQSAPQGQQSTPQQMRPQSRMANPNEQTPNQQQQHPQQGQGQQGQQGGQPQGQQQGQQGQQPTPQQNQQQQALLQQQRQQQFAMLQRAQRQSLVAANQGGQGGMFILRLMNFSDHLSNFDESTGKNIAQWHALVERHFAPEGRLIHGIDAPPPGRPKLYEVLRPSIARYFLTYFEAGATSLRLHTEHAREVPHPTGNHQVTCQNAVLSVTYPNGIRLEMNGSLQVLFTAGGDAIECLQFQTMNTEEVLSRSQVEKVVSEFSPSLPTKSPKMAKNKLPKAQQKMQEQQERLTIEHFPKASKGTYGITSKVQHFLEIGETMNVMSDLMWYAQEKKLRPEQAMEALIAQYDSQTNGQPGGNPQINLPPNGVPPGQRTPSMGNMQMPQNGGNFSSPNVSNLNLPMQPNGMNGSPHMGNNPGNLAPNMNMANSHTPSPHQGNMAAPQMMPQHSQQGTNSSVASASTSPNINNSNKRRRSTVKLEGDDGGGADGNANANRVKPSPRMAKKPKP